MTCNCTDPTQADGAKPGRVIAYVSVVDGDCLRDDGGRCRVFLDEASALEAGGFSGTAEPVAV